MKNIARFLKVSVLILLSTSLLQSCFLFNKNKGGGISSTTGAAYGTAKDSLAFRPHDTQNLPNPPGMVFVQGGRTILGSFEQDLFGKDPLNEQKGAYFSFISVIFLNNQRTS